MNTETKLGRRIALKKKLEEEFRLAEERKNNFQVRRFHKTESQEKQPDVDSSDTQPKSYVESSAGSNSEVQDTIASNDVELGKVENYTREDHVDEEEKKLIVRRIGADHK